MSRCKACDAILPNYPVISEILIGDKDSEESIPIVEVLCEECLLSLGEYDNI